MLLLLSIVCAWHGAYRLHDTIVEPWIEHVKVGSGPKVTGENYLLVLPGMTKQDVYDVLGSPTQRDYAHDGTNTTRWEGQDGRAISVVFKDDVVLRCRQCGLDDEIGRGIAEP